MSPTSEPPSAFERELTAFALTFPEADVKSLRWMFKELAQRPPGSERSVEVCILLTVSKMPVLDLDLRATVKSERSPAIALDIVVWLRDQHGASTGGDWQVCCGDDPAFVVQQLRIWTQRQLERRRGRG